MKDILGRDVAFGDIVLMTSRREHPQLGIGVIYRETAKKLVVCFRMTDWLDNSGATHSYVNDRGTTEPEVQLVKVELKDLLPEQRDTVIELRQKLGFK